MKQYVSAAVAKAAFAKAAGKNVATAAAKNGKVRTKKPARVPGTRGKSGLGMRGK
jgi:hypothetical protein